MCFKRFAVVFALFGALFFVSGAERVWSGAKKQAPAGQTAPPPVSQTAPQPAAGQSLNDGINDIILQLLARIERGRKVSVRNIEADNRKLSDYIVAELLKGLGAGGLTIVDRQNLAVIDAESDYEYDSGKVSDDALRSVTSQDAPEYIITGKISRIGNQYNIVLSAINQETVLSSTVTARVGPDPFLEGLLNDDASLDDIIDRAVSDLGGKLTGKRTVKVGRISHLVTKSTTSFSNYLVNAVERGGAAASGRFQIMDGKADTDAVITGSFIPRGRDVEVSLTLVSKDGATLGAARFAVPVSELDQMGLSAELPPNVTADDYIKKEAAGAVYDSVENEFGLKITFDRDSAIYHDGELMSFTVDAAEDCYIRVEYVDVRGIKALIYPISSRQNNFIKAGVPKKIPDTGTFTIAKPYGEEIILVTAFREQFDGSDAASVAFNEATAKAGLTGRSILSSDINMAPAAAARLTYTVQER